MKLDQKISDAKELLSTNIWVDMRGHIGMTRENLNKVVNLLQEVEDDLKAQETNAV